MRPLLFLLLAGVLLGAGSGCGWFAPPFKKIDCR